MTAYVLFLAFIFICIICKKTIQDLKGLDVDKLFAFMGLFFLLFFAAVRGSTVGADTKQYIHYYNAIFKENRLSHLNEAISAWVGYQVSVEIGYLLFVKVIQFLFGSFCSEQVITCVTSILIFALLWNFIKKESSNKMLSVWLYVVLGVFQTQMNMARNAIAILLVFIAIPYVRKRKFWKYFFIVLLAMLFHRTAVVFIPLYWLMQLQVSKKIATTILVASMVITVFDAFVVHFLNEVLPQHYLMYFVPDKTTGAGVKIILFVFQAICVLFVAMNLRKEERITLKRDIYIQYGEWMFLLNAASYVLSFQLRAFTRVAALFGPYLIVFIPQMLEHIKSPRRKEKITAILILMTGIIYIIRLSFNNIGGTMPYVFGL